MKKKIILAIIVLFIVIFLIGFNSTDIYIVSHSSGSFITSASTSCYSVNSKFKFKMPGFKKDKNIIENNISTVEKALENGMEKIKEVDEDAFLGKYNTLDELVFVIDNYIYYYRNDIYDKFYRYNTNTCEIEELNLSNYAHYIENEGMHNFTVQNDIKTEALLDFYPGLTEQIEKMEGTFYNETFYDNGRVFFCKNDTLYEYVHGENKVKKIIGIRRDANMDYVFVKQ